MSVKYYKYVLSLYGKKTAFDVDYILKERGICSADIINRCIYEGIMSKRPFFAGRIGGTEFSVIKDYLMSKHFIGIGYIRNKLVYQLFTWSGFFPKKRRLAVQFAKLMIDSIKETDILIRWWGGIENYLIEEYTSKEVKLASLPSFEPWQEGVTLPWSAALKGKKVLVIHPFEDTIISQYKKREKIWPGTDILPEFELKTLKAVQTIAGQKDERFKTWFEALEYMYQKALKIDFDIAIIGCGAYGFPLAAKLKKAGKQAIHLAGATQILFGIKGARWETKEFAFIHQFFNDAWCYPKLDEKPKEAKKVEGACYW